MTNDTNMREKLESENKNMYSVFILKIKIFF